MPDTTTTPTTPARSAAAELAHAYIDHAPECAKSADDYEWQMRPLGLGEMRATQMTTDGRGIDPAKSGQVPVVVSYGDDEYAPLAVWDGVHRILSSLITGKGSRMAAVGVKKEGIVYLDDLSEDMNELVSSLLEEAGVEIPSTVPTRAVRVDRFPDVGLATGPDDRGLAHAADMAGQYLPPVVVNGDVWMDGRHRIHHLKETGVEWMLAIDLAGLLPAPKPGEAMHLGVLKSMEPVPAILPTFTQEDLNLIKFFLPEKLSDAVLATIRHSNAVQAPTPAEPATHPKTAEPVLAYTPTDNPHFSDSVMYAIVKGRSAREINEILRKEAQGVGQEPFKLLSTLTATSSGAKNSESLFALPLRPDRDLLSTTGTSKLGRAWGQRIMAVAAIKPDAVHRASPAFKQAFAQIAETLAIELRKMRVHPNYANIDRQPTAQKALLAFTVVAAQMDLMESVIKIESNFLAAQWDSKAVQAIDAMEHRAKGARNSSAVVDAALERKTAALSAIEKHSQPKARKAP